MRRAAVALAVVALGGWVGGLSPQPAAAGKDDRVRLEVEVTAEETGEPIGKATIYVKYQQERFLRRDKKFEFSTKTDAEGKATFPPLPAGRVLVQVIGKGWKTYGRYHELQGPKHILEIKLKPAKKWS